MIFKIEKKYLEAMKNGTKTIEMRSAKSFIEKLNFYNGTIKYQCEGEEIEFYVSKLVCKSQAELTESEIMNILQCKKKEIRNAMYDISKKMETSTFDQVVLIYLDGIRQK